MRCEHFRSTQTDTPKSPVIVNSISPFALCFKEPITINPRFLASERQATTAMRRSVLRRQVWGSHLTRLVKTLIGVLHKGQNAVTVIKQLAAWEKPAAECRMEFTAGHPEALQPI